MRTYVDDCRDSVVLAARTLVGCSWLSFFGRRIVLTLSYDRLLANVLELTKAETAEDERYRIRALVSDALAETMKASQVGAFSCPDSPTRKKR